MKNKRYFFVYVRRDNTYVATELANQEVFNMRRRSLGHMARIMDFGKTEVHYVTSINNSRVEVQDFLTHILTQESVNNAAG